MYKKGRVNSNSRIISTDEYPSLRIESSAIIKLRGVSTKLNKYIIEYVVKSVLCISSAYNKGVGILLTFSETRIYIINKHSKQEHSVSILYFRNIEVQWEVQ